MSEQKSLLYCETLNNFLKLLMERVRFETKQLQQDTDKIRLEIKRINKL